jgi:hypothetical protein
MPDPPANSLPSISVPVDQFVREVAAEAARATWDKCRAECPVVELRTEVKDLQKDVVQVKIHFAALVGLMFGSGAIGGTTGVFLAKLL